MYYLCYNCVFQGAVTGGERGASRKASRSWGSYMEEEEKPGWGQGVWAVDMSNLGGGGGLVVFIWGVGGYYMLIYYALKCNKCVT